MGWMTTIACRQIRSLHWAGERGLCQRPGRLHRRETKALRLLWDENSGTRSAGWDQWMVMMRPSVAESGDRSQARITGTNLSVRMRVSAMEPSSRSRYSVLVVFCL